MKEFLDKYLRGDRYLWGITLFFTLFSLVVVFSAVTNLRDNSTPTQYLWRHLGFIVTGLAVMWVAHAFAYRYHALFFAVAVWITIFLLFYAAFFTTGSAENTMEALNERVTNDRRWVRLFNTFTIQPALFAWVAFVGYAAHFFAINYQKKITRKRMMFFSLYFFLIVMLVVLANFSTAFLIFSSVVLLAFLAYFPMRYIFWVVGAIIAAFALFVLIAKAAPDLFPNRVDTWAKRIENYVAIIKPDMLTEEQREKIDDYQVERSKMAIAKGYWLGQGPGESTMKNFLPQSSSDFIYAILTEEYGMVGALFVMSLYVLLCYRIFLIAKNANSFFGKLLVLGFGAVIMLQAVVNMAVAVAFIPVTGQNLPFISNGGTSLITTYFMMGCILSVSAQPRKGEEMAKDMTIVETFEDMQKQYDKL